MAEQPGCLDGPNDSLRKILIGVNEIADAGGAGGGGNVNLTGINGIAPSVNNGTSDAGTLRVTIASDSTGSVAVSGTLTPTIGALTDRSGTITVGGASQQLAPANATRKYFVIENVSSDTLWINFGVAAVQNQPSIKILPNGYFFMENSFVSNQVINIIGPTTGQAFTSKEAS